MREGCLGNCLICGKCAGFAILDSFQTSGKSTEPQPEPREDLRVSPKLPEGYGIAVDIGTTTVVMALLDLSTGRVLARHSFMNPQRAFGPDVISRIHAANEGHLAKLRGMIVRAIAAGLAELLAAHDISLEAVAHIAIAGNTTMTHLLLGLPCGSLGVFPFKPAFSLAELYEYAVVFGNVSDDELCGGGSCCAKADNAGSQTSRTDSQTSRNEVSNNAMQYDNACPKAENSNMPVSVDSIQNNGLACPLSIFPLFTAFVSGDIMAGLLHVLREGNKRFLLIDLGTNGEMALMDGERLIVTSTAAGPAFESGQGGASGAIHALAALVRAGAVDETGLLLKEAVFTQRQIRDLQLAKSAVRSGLEILLEVSGLAYGDLDAVYLAGGIGQAMDVRDAVQIGLLPDDLREKARAVGNASLGGAVRLLGAPEAAARDMERLLAVAAEINLAEHPMFNDCFMEYMGFE